MAMSTAVCTARLSILLVVGSGYVHCTGSVLLGCLHFWWLVVAMSTALYCRLSALLVVGSGYVHCCLYC